ARRAGDDQRRAGAVDQHRVGLVHDGKDMPALNDTRRVSCGVVTQVVKAKLGGRAVGDIGLVAFLPQRGPPVYEALVLQVPARIDIAGVVDGGFLLLADHGGAQAQQVVDRAHPATVTAGEVVVDRDEVDATPGQRIEVHRQGGDER